MKRYSLFLDKEKKSDLKCPISGEVLYFIKKNNYLDGPSSYFTKDKKYEYERWPRAFDKLFLIKIENEYIKNILFIRENNKWKKYYDLFDEYFDENEISTVGLKDYIEAKRDLYIKHNNRNEKKYKFF